MEFADVCRHYLGEKAYYVAIVFAVLTFSGASIVYWVSLALVIERSAQYACIPLFPIADFKVLMSSFLYNTIDYFHGLPFFHLFFSLHPLTADPHSTSPTNSSIAPCFNMSVCTNTTSIDDHKSTWCYPLLPCPFINLSPIISPKLTFPGTRTGHPPPHRCSLRSSFSRS